MSMCRKLQALWTIRGEQGDNITSDNTLTLFGATRAGYTVVIMLAVIEIGRAIADEHGNWELEAPKLDPGKHKFAAYAIDFVGNNSDNSDKIKITIIPDDADADFAFDDNVGVDLTVQPAETAVAPNTASGTSLLNASLLGDTVSLSVLSGSEVLRVNVAEGTEQEISLSGTYSALGVTLLGGASVNLVFKRDVSGQNYVRDTENSISE
ncbi:Ig-like domain-containing protein [Pseudochelatococcus sp. B33]